MLSHANVAPVREVTQAVQCATLNIIHLGFSGADAPESLSEMEQPLISSCEPATGSVCESGQPGDALRLRTGGSRDKGDAVMLSSSNNSIFISALGCS